MSDSTEIVLHPGHDRAPARRRRADDPAGPPPAIVAAAGPGAEFAWDEFFKGQLANAYTRRNYAHAVRHFLAWCDRPDRQIPLVRITPGHVGDYLAGLQLATPTKKLRLAALRKFFDLLVVRHVVILNPAASVRAERYSTVEGKTPEIGTAQARNLLKSIEASDVVGIRDRAIIAVLIYTAARAGAVAKLTLKSLRHDGTQYSLRFAEKGGKARESPVRHDLERLLLAYIEAAGITEGPLFRPAFRRTKKLTARAMSGIDICRMMKRRLKAAGLPGQFSPHSFRVATVTDLLEQNVPLEDVQHLAGHADPRTTRLYDRRRRKVTRNIVERISI
ncbi:tyrosine-type recombinase/integrase [Tautonia plasticadhaerens]|uniref:Tyrosine recombinase XerC n=1 Tax=Tautonia plasticadhaerens TaxID=2527974 RepID=A0A518HF66_9BACT|nr:tyrosine-type recombinase/integrase [Tautonia plasticadhaerens]QDV39471.1 Tyrosine recombinase XerC [Tautonia plasticadhaerens]